MRRRLEGGEDPGEKESWEEQGRWERTGMSARDEVAERDGDSWQGTGLHGGTRTRQVDEGDGGGQGRLGDKDAWREEDMEEGQGFPGAEDSWGEEDIWEKQDFLGGTRTVGRDKEDGCRGMRTVGKDKDTWHGGQNNR